MKKLMSLIVLIICILMSVMEVFAEQTSINEAENNPFLVSDDIRKQYELKEGDKAYLYSVCWLGYFRTSANTIDKFIESKDGFAYIIELSDGSVKMGSPSSDGSPVTYSAEELEERGDYILSILKPLNALLKNDVIKKVSPDIQVYGKCYLNGGAEMRSGRAVYYRTDRGDYVYYDHPSSIGEGEYLFPIEEFCKYQKLVYENGGGLQQKLWQSWDLSRYDINSPEFLQGEPNNPTLPITSTVAQTTAPPSSTASSSQVPDAGLVIGGAVGTVMLVAAAVGFAVARKRKAKG